MTARPVRVLLVDDNHQVRLALRRRLANVAGMAVVGESGSVADAVVDAEATRPDIVVLDLRLPDGSGATAARRIRSRRPDVAVIILTSASDDEASAGAMVAGACAVVRKQLRGDDIAETVRQVAAGGVELDATCRARAVAVLARHPDPLGTMVAAGKTDRQIASELDLDEESVGRQVAAMADTLAGTSSRLSG